MDEQTDKLGKEIADAEKEREKLQTQQSDDQRGIARQQKNVERYLAKRQVLMQRKDECNKNIRDLGVLPEEAFAETTASSEKVRSSCRRCFPRAGSHPRLHLAAPQEAPQGQRGAQGLCAREQEGLRAVHVVHQAA